MTWRKLIEGLGMNMDSPARVFVLVDYSRVSVHVEALTVSADVDGVMTVELTEAQVQSLAVGLPDASKEH